MDNTCLNTLIRNTSGGTRNFSFLPPHGIRMAAGEEVSIVGDLVQALSRSVDGAGRRNIISLQKALDAGDLMIVSSPSQILHDDTKNKSRILHLNNDVLTVVDPSFADSVSV